MLQSRLPQVHARWIRHTALALTFVIALPAASFAPCATAQAQTAPARALPDKLGDAEFWKLVNDISEPGGYFRIEDNYTSNEMEIGQLETMLRDAHISGGVYLGVGPEQNFSYIAAIRPKMAFICDIRRQAVMQHLMFKAVFEQAHDRAAFISLLFAKPRPAGIDSTTSIQAIWDAYRNVPSDDSLAERNYTAIVDRLTKTQGFTFTADESDKLKAVYSAFVRWGPGITTRGSMSGRGGGLSFADLTGAVYDAKGQVQSFLSTEDNYRFVKSLQDKNLIIAVSGDFGGPKAIRAIGTYLKDHNATVSAFYVSNVEQYLFQDRKDRVFDDNVATLPMDSTSVFIRPYSLRNRFGASRPLCPIASYLRAVAAGRVVSNNDSLACPSPDTPGPRLIPSAAPAPLRRTPSLR
jgi:hypothetical protein